MALFKISKGLSSKIPGLDKSQDGWCWFTTDDGLFHIDYEDNGKLKRKTLNANDAKTLTGASLETGADISDSAIKIPSSKLVNTALNDVRSDITENAKNIATKMDKENPQGSGKVSINGTASGDKAVSFGGTASGVNSFSGGSAKAEGAESFAFGGINTEAKGNNSFAFGVKAKANGNDSVAFGNGNEATGQASFAEGDETIATGDNSHAAGFGTKASHKSQFVIGEFNAIDNSDNAPTSRGKYAFIIGNGTSNSLRNNALSVDWLGNSYIQSSLNIGLPNNIMGTNSFGVNGDAYFNSLVSVNNNYFPTADNHLVNKKYIQDNLPNLSHKYIISSEGQSSFDFSSQGINSLDKFYLVFYDGLLLIKNMHYTTSGTIVNLLNWTSSAGHIVHVVGFAPTNPDN